MSFLQLAAGLTGQPSMPNNMPSAGVNPPATATERASRSVFGTDDLNDMLICFKMPALPVLLSLDARNHVDDYSGTLGGVRKVHISALVTSP